ncbi:MAG TPA: NUDIX domain-containing protein [Alphaproteobacteria bacterium]|jgi:ADP-ribose pyrophosphatase|nr:NUDIX domain-containing protein [Alphaproteobacteria bacterium]
MNKPPRSVEVLEKASLYQDYYRTDKYRLQYEQFRGGMGQPVWREVLERGHAATVLPFDPQRDEVVLIEQFRIGPFAAGHQPWTIEVVAGIVEQGEEPEEVTRREAVEEAGCTIAEMEPIAGVFPSAGVVSEYNWHFVGRVSSEGVGGIHGLDHEGEDIKVLVMPRPEAEDLVRQRRIQTGQALISLLWLALNHQYLKARWT